MKKICGKTIGRTNFLSKSFVYYFTWFKNRNISLTIRDSDVKGLSICILSTQYWLIFWVFNTQKYILKIFRVEFLTEIQRKKKDTYE